MSEHTIEIAVGQVWQWEEEPQGRSYIGIWIVSKIDPDGAVEITSLF